LFAQIQETNNEQLSLPRKCDHPTGLAENIFGSNQNKFICLAVHI